MSPPFRVREHRILGQHIREYPGATAHGDDEALQIVIKQYAPIDNPIPQHGDVTIIATHANAHCKELYEPLWEEIHARSCSAKFRIRSIWVADSAQQGASYIMVNHFREQMPTPIVGVGHSAGGAQMLFLSHLHPRLLHSIVLIEPSLNVGTPRQATKLVNMNAKYAVFRKDAWPSRSEAAAWFSKNPVYKDWDPRVMSQLLHYELRQKPTLIHPNADVNNAVTLRTPKHQEAFFAVRPNFDGVSVNKPASAEERITHPDIDPESPYHFPFYRTETRQAFFLLKTVRPSVLFVHGEKSLFATPDVRAVRVSITGTGPGGNGGAELGRVKEAVLPGGHFVVMELVNETATCIAGFLGDELNRWKENERSFKEQWERNDTRQKQMVGDRWTRVLTNTDKPQREGKSKL